MRCVDLGALSALGVIIIKNYPENICHLVLDKRKKTI
jgi:hypothetical protein